MQAQFLHPVECRVTPATTGDCVCYASEVPRSPRLLLTRLDSAHPVRRFAARQGWPTTLDARMRLPRGMFQCGQPGGAMIPCGTRESARAQPPTVMVKIDPIRSSGPG